MTRVLATGTFDILHPGHVHYLTEAKKLGDELFVIVAWESMIKHKPRPIIPTKQRVMMVNELKVVDRAIAGSKHDIFEPLRKINPDIIALGHDQHFDQQELEKTLKEKGFDIKVVRVSKFRECDICSSGKIIKEIIDRYSTDK
ncbi:cytidyltransferase-related domain protein [Methanosalsum zhilinae DSM 4017]|uniref:FAD synthase n=1 Tax=Methanosalsum zhilinae (strain DSM 4017 / NBRC 107636 / OCM 62 / WeN5) TaxID=679901 RepID=F7XL96_METZD|nr:adenylyltransferase/cytidyltransferase family protein [Methanosalsum zhilinae]AEH60753.1 cytidyltransferase-related domain protein [Methanosalsum zhilinae DSM 4017]